MNYKFEKYTKENINKYKSKNNLLKHARCNSNTDGVFLLNKENEMVGYIEWEKEWIIALETSKEFRNMGIAKILLDYAISKNAKNYL